MRFDDGSLKLYTVNPDHSITIAPGVRDAVISMLREALVPPNRFARVDAAISSLDILRGSPSVTVQRAGGISQRMNVADLIDELRIALQDERGAR
jgi:hypothetical protein